MGVELRQPREIAEDNRQNSGGGRIERAEVSDGALTKMRRTRLTTSCESEPGGLVDDDYAIHEDL